LLAPANWIASPLLPGSQAEREAHWLDKLLQAKSNDAVTNILEQGYLDLHITRRAAHNLDDSLLEKLQRRIDHYKLIDSHHQYVDGTSVAAPIVSSVISQMLEANHNLTPVEIRNILMSTAQPVSEFPVEQQGAGLLNARSAVLKATGEPIQLDLS
jgi:serine protease AprX